MTDADRNDDVLAGEYVLGTLAGAEREHFKARLRHDAGLQDLVAAWERRLGALAERVAPAPPPKNSFAAIERRIGAEAKPGSRTIRGDAGEWSEIEPGVAMKRLFRSPDDESTSFLLRLLPGAVLPPHPHPSNEECLVIDGEITIGELRLGAGDYHVAFRGSPHDVIRSERGALLFIRGALHA